LDPKEFEDENMMRSKISRKIEWKSTLHKDNVLQLNCLQKDLMEFYESNENYYKDIDFTNESWLDKNEILNQDIISECNGCVSILEIGCGKANILRTTNVSPVNYTGIDFSERLIDDNKKNFPTANFLRINDPQKFPLASENFDLVFSHFVLEHSVFPNKMLNESLRVLRRTGKLIILCPDFLAKGGISSQRSGFSKGTGREKLQKGKILDAFVTGFDNKVKMPLYCLWYRVQANLNPKFYINLNPVCFNDPFIPDVDAVYLTYENEIKNFLNVKINWVKHDKKIRDFAQKKSLIYLKGIKL
jgi:SAM-dependent methyltransferase